VSAASASDGFASTPFDRLPLHDAVFYELRIDWEARRCELFVAAFVVNGDRARPHVLAFTGVTRVVIPSEAPWGPSVFVNDLRLGEDGAFLIEVQSGDIIEIRAEAFSFAPGER
jgi:hypothetical protein